MSYTLLDDELPESAKWAGLSDAAFRFGIRLLCWARKPKQMRRRPGFVPTAMAADLARKSSAVASRLARELVTAGHPLHEEGILVTTEGGWIIHDFPQYGRRPEPDPQPEQIDLEASNSNVRSAAARLAGKASAEARRSRTGTAQPTSPNGSPERNLERPRTDLPNGTSNVPERISRTEPRTSPNGRRSSSQDLSQDPRSPISERSKESTTSLKTCQVDARAEQTNPHDERVPCPTDLKLLPDQRATLEVNLMPGWAIDAITVSFVASATGAPNDRRTLEHWRKCLSKACCSTWNDRSKRPKKPEEEVDTDRQRRGSERQQRMAEQDARELAEQTERARENLRKAGIDPDAALQSLDLKNLVAGIG